MFDRLGPPDPPADEVRGVYFTSVRDDQTCPACAGADDDLPRRLGDPTRLRPPHPDCTSPQGCRCADVFIMEAEEPPSGGYRWSPYSTRAHPVDHGGCA